LYNRFLITLFTDAQMTLEQRVEQLTARRLPSIRVLSNPALSNPALCI
jgi:hypothetical protein